jgi:hypothetical protein
MKIHALNAKSGFGFPKIAADKDFLFPIFVRRNLWEGSWAQFLKIRACALNR